MTVVMTAANNSIKVMGVTYHRGRTVEVSDDIGQKLCATGSFSRCEPVVEEVAPMTIEDELAACKSAQAVKALAEKYDIDVSDCKNSEQRKQCILAAFANI